MPNRAPAAVQGLGQCAPLLPLPDLPLPDSRSRSVREPDPNAKGENEGKKHEAGDRDDDGDSAGDEEDGGTPGDGPALRHPHCCLALSRGLVRWVACRILGFAGEACVVGREGDGEQGCERWKRRCVGGRAENKARTVVLSIGSGQGLLEGLLAREFESLAWVEQEGRVEDAGYEGEGEVEGSVDGDGGEAASGEQRQKDTGRERRVEGHLVAGEGYYAGGARVYGVEVPSLDGEMNRYLDERRRIVVRGVWDVLGVEMVRELLQEEHGDQLQEHDLKMQDEETQGEDGEVHVWLMFVFPRQVSLVTQYLKEWQAGCPSRTANGPWLAGVIWAGPRCDWDDYKHVFRDIDKGQWQVSQIWGPVADMAKGEGIAVARRHGYVV